MSNTETIAQDIHCHHLWYYEKECAVNSFFLNLFKSLNL